MNLAKGRKNSKTNLAQIILLAIAVAYEAIALIIKKCCRNLAISFLEC